MKTITLTELQSSKLKEAYTQKAIVEKSLQDIMELIGDIHGLKKEDKVTMSNDFKTLTVEES